MNKNDIEYFMALYKSRSLSKASIICHTDKSTISKAVIKLENELNTTFFERKNG